MELAQDRVHWQVLVLALVAYATRELVN